MNEYPDYTYTQSAAQYNDWMAEKYPDMNAEIAKRIKEGRWEIVGGMWVEPDLNMPDGESLVRQILVGKRWYKQAYGVDVRIGWNPDCFGYNWQLPQIYKKSGVDYFVTQKMTWNDTNQLPFKLFWWQSPDGSKVLTYFPHDYGNTTLNPVRLAADLAHARAARYRHDRDDRPLRHRRPRRRPTRAVLDEGMHWASRTLPTSPRSISSAPRSPTSLRLKNRSRLTAPSGTTSPLPKVTRRLPLSQAKSPSPPGTASSISNITAASSLRRPTRSTTSAPAKSRCSMRKNGLRWPGSMGKLTPS